MQTNEAFQHVSRETAELMRDFASFRLPRRNKEGDYNMCKAVQEIERKGVVKGISIGEARGEARGEVKGRIKDIKMIMQYFNLTAEQALEALGVPKSEFDKYLSMI